MVRANHIHLATRDARGNAREPVVTPEDWNIQMLQHLSVGKESDKQIIDCQSGCTPDKRSMGIESTLIRVEDTAPSLQTREVRKLIFPNSCK